MAPILGGSAWRLFSTSSQTAVVDVSDEAGRTATRTKMRTGTSGSSRADAPDHRARRSVWWGLPLRAHFAGKASV